MPAMREFGKELGLTDPFEADAPVHLRYSTDIKHMPQAASKFRRMASSRRKAEPLPSAESLEFQGGAEFRHPSRLQCDISTGMVMLARIERVAPPSSNSRTRK